VRARLVVIDGEEGTRQFDLQLPAIIGRSRSTDLRVGHPLVSRHHCEVFESEGHVMVRDLGSLNGTFIGETRLDDQPVTIEPGDKFTIGPVTIEAQYQSPPERSREAGWEDGGATIDSPLGDSSLGELRGDAPHGESTKRPHGDSSHWRKPLP